MNQTIKTLKNHKSIRRFKNKEISDKILREIITCGIRASSSGNMQGWSLIITKDKKQKDLINEKDEDIEKKDIKIDKLEKDLEESEDMKKKIVD